MVVAPGVTLLVPVSGTVPTALSMVTVVAFCTCQESVELAPCTIDVGFAVNDTMIGGPPPVPLPTVTVARC